MSETKAKPAAALSDFTISVNSLANNAARESAVVDFSSSNYLDAQLRLEFTLASGAVTAGGKIDIYCYAGLSAGSYTDNATGADAALTMRSPTNLFFLTSIQVTADLAAAAAWKCIVPSVAMAFGGVLPTYWGIVVVNNATGRAFHSSGNVAKYRGLNAQTV